MAKVFITTSTEHVHLNGLEIENLKPLPEDEYDRDDVGDMFTGIVGDTAMHMFADEIIEK